MERMRNAELPDRLDLMAQRMAQAATNARQFSDAVKPLWATLNDEQKRTVRRMMPGGGEGGGWRQGQGEGGRGSRGGYGGWGGHGGHGGGWGYGDRRG